MARCLADSVPASIRQYTHTFDRWRINKNVPAKVKRHAARKLYRNPRMSEPTFHQGGHFEHICRPVDVARFRRDNPDFDPSTSPTCSEFGQGALAGMRLIAAQLRRPYWIGQAMEAKRQRQLPLNNSSPQPQCRHQPFQLVSKLDFNRLNKRTLIYLRP